MLHVQEPGKDPLKFLYREQEHRHTAALTLVGCIQFAKVTKGRSDYRNDWKSRGGAARRMDRKQFERAIVNSALIEPVADITDQGEVALVTAAMVLAIVSEQSKQAGHTQTVPAQIKSLASRALSTAEIKESLEDMESLGDHRAGRYVKALADLALYAISHGTPASMLENSFVKEVERLGAGRLLKIWGNRPQAEAAVAFLLTLTVARVLRELASDDFWATLGDEEALAKDAEEILQNAKYPGELDRFFQVLRQHGLSMKLAATCRDDSRGMFERWQFSQNSGERNATSVTVRFWHDTRDLDWQSTLSKGDKINAQGSGETLEQLEVQLALWALAK